MKRPPETPEFARFATAVSDILKVSKAELQGRIEVQKKNGKRLSKGRFPRFCRFIQNPFFFRRFLESFLGCLASQFCIGQSLP